MTKKCRASAHVFLLLLLLPAGVGAGSQGVAAVDGQRTVWLVVSTKGEGETAPTLRPEDLRVTEGGDERRIVSLAVEPDAPLHVAVVIDVSGSQEHLIEGNKSAAIDFVKTALRPGRDQAAVVSFASKAVVEAPLAPDLGRAVGALARIKFEPPSGYVSGGVIISRQPPPDNITISTSFWDAAAFVSREVFKSAPSDAARVLVLLSDGQDTSSRTKKKEAVESLVGAGVVVYSIGVGDSKNYAGLNRDALRQVAEESGGAAVFPKKANDLSAAFAEVRDTLRSRYLLTYSSPGESSAKTSRKLKVEIVTPELRRRGLRVSHQPRPAPSVR